MFVNPLGIPYKLIDSSEEDASATFFIDSTVTGELDSSYVR